jgi:hypothetical protein
LGNTPNTNTTGNPGLVGALQSFQQKKVLTQATKIVQNPGDGRFRVEVSGGNSAEHFRLEAPFQQHPVAVVLESML